MASPDRPTVTSTPLVSTDSPRGRGERAMSPGLSLSKPSAKPNGALTMKWIHSTWAGVNGSPAAMLNSVAPRNVRTKTISRDQHEPDVLVRLSGIRGPARREHDRGEAVVGQDDPAGVPRPHLGAAADGDPMSAALIVGLVDAVAVIATTSPFFLSVSASRTLCSGRPGRVTPISSMRAEPSVSERGRSWRRGWRPADADLLGDGRTGDDVVPGQPCELDVAAGAADRVLDWSGWSTIPTRLAICRPVT